MPLPVIPTAPPIPTNIAIAADNGLVTRPWIAWFNYLGKLFGFNQTIEANGVPSAQEIALNFLPPFIVTDNPANESTDISLPAATYSLQRGTVQANATGNDYSTANVVFTAPFTAVPQVFVNPTNFARFGNNPLSCYATSITNDGFTVNLSCSVPTGGGGDTIDNQINVDWIAIG